MAEFPPLAPVPSPAVRRTIPSNDWEACLDAWMALLGIRLNASDEQFKVAAAEDTSIPPFLSSYYQYTAAGDSTLQSGPKARQLRKFCFLAIRRYMLDLSNPPDGILDWRLLGNLCCCYPSSAALKTLLSSAWNLHQGKITSSIERAKAVVIKNLSSTNSSSNPEVISDIRRLAILASVLPACGQELMAGSDFLDTISEAYQSKGAREEFRKILVANIYVGLVSLLKEPVNLSSLLDQLFSLKAAARVGAPKMKKEATLLSDLICSSDLLIRLEKYLSIHPQKRGQDLLASLHTYQVESKSLHHRYQRRKKVDKGKEVSSDPIVSGELHAHKMSLVTQVQDLFPDLGSAFVVRLLDFYNDNPETIVAHLLDDSLPLELQSLDRSEQLPPPVEPHHSHLPPEPTPPTMPSPPFAPLSTRKNVFDKDVDIAELSRSGEGQGKLHFGRVDADQTADTILADHSKHAANKAAILSALATFDSDDDERDDTYDTADVGGAIDGATGGADGEADAAERNRRAVDVETMLFRTYKSNPGLFARDSATRRSQPRASLKRETEMTDEAIEGWAVMLTRDPKRLAKLEDRLAMDAGGLAGAGSLNQPELRSTSYRRPQPREDGEGSDEGESFGHAGSRGGRGGSGRGGRGRGGGGRGRGGRGGGPPSGGQGQPDKDSAASRQRKEENKGSRANHNRRQQHAKKMARGGGLPG